MWEIFFFKQIYKCQGKRIINLPFSLNLSIISRKYKSFKTIFYRFCSMDSFFSLSARTHIAILYLTEKFLATFFFRVLSLRKSECTQKFRCFLYHESSRVFLSRRECFRRSTIPIHLQYLSSKSDGFKREKKREMMSFEGIESKEPRYFSVKLFL